jgi:hypothetical protein
LLREGEVFPTDPARFDKDGHQPRLIQIDKGHGYAALGALENGSVFVSVEQDGHRYACVLLADSFDLA